MEKSIKQFVLKTGADVCGITSIDRFEGAPEGFNPRDIYKDCRSAVVFGKRLPKGIASVSPRIIYNHMTEINVRELDRIAFLTAIEIENMSGIAVPLPSDTPYDYWESGTLTGKGVLSMKHAAVLAGLGSMGKNTLVINETYGNMLNFGAVLTDLDLRPDELSSELCIEGCRRCLDACPQQALNGVTANQKLCRPFAYGSNDRGFEVVNCNRCRLACPRAFGVR